MIVQSIDATAAPGIISSESAGRASGCGVKGALHGIVTVAESLFKAIVEILV